MLKLTNDTEEVFKLGLTVPGMKVIGKMIKLILEES